MVYFKSACTTIYSYIFQSGYKRGQPDTAGEGESVQHAQREHERSHEDILQQECHACRTIRHHYTYHK